jgi:hypothetical protein
MNKIRSRTILLVIFLAFSSSLFSQKGVPPKALEELKESNFKPHMIDHIYEGCPTNSSCLKEAGSRYQAWIEKLNRYSKRPNGWKSLEEYRKKHGIPLEVWTLENGLNNKELIHWDSPCTHHNQKGQRKIMIGLGLGKSFGELIKKNKKSILVRRALLENHHGESISYLIPRGETPLYISNKELIYIKSVEGNYFGLSVGSKGKVKIVPVTEPPKYPKTITCPPPLLQDFGDLSKDQKIYQGAYCQMLYNTTQNKYETMVFGWSCN